MKTYPLEAKNISYIYPQTEMQMAGSATESFSFISRLMSRKRIPTHTIQRTLEKSDYKLWAAIERLKAGYSDEGSSKSAEN